MNNFESLRQARLNMGLSLEEAAEGICSVSLLSLIERGKRNVTAKVQTALEERLGAGLAKLKLASFSDEYLHVLAKIRNGSITEASEQAVLLQDDKERALATALTLEQQGKDAEAVELLEKLLRAPELPAHFVIPVAQGLTRLEFARADVYSAIYWAEEGLRIVQTYGDTSIDTYPLKATLASVYLEVGDFSRAQQLVKNIDLTPEPTWNRVISLWSAGSILNAESKYKEAAEVFRQAVALSSYFDRQLSKMQLLQSSVWLDLMSEELVDFELARDRIEQVVKYFREEQIDEDLAGALNTYALLEWKSGSFDDAQKKAQESIEIARTLPEFAKANLFVANGEVLVKLDDQEPVRVLLSDALGILSQTKADRLVATVWARLGKVYEALGDQQAAFTCYQASIEAAGILPSEVKTR